MNKVFLCLAVLLLMHTGAHAQPATGLGETVQVENGALRGAPRNPQGLLVFKGIPFAAPPVGSLRWQEFQPAKPWDGTRDATGFGNRCWANVRVPSLAGRSGGVPLGEDCLFLNLWTGAKTASEKRPVMVWIHGGGFQFGTAGDPNTDGALLA